MADKIEPTKVQSMIGTVMGSVLLVFILFAILYVTGSAINFWEHITLAR
jgi:hypothetical protein